MASKEDDKKGDTVSVTVAKTPAELQRMRLEKLMKNPTKPVFIPEPSKGPKMKEPPEFIRNVWGSSAGAGSGDFHVYRGVRRREYARQKFIAEMAKLTEAEQEYHKKMEENKKAAEERTAKKRAKRLKKKEKMKNKRMKKQENKEDSSDSEEEEKKGNSKLSRGGDAEDICDSDSAEHTDDGKGMLKADIKEES